VEDGGYEERKVLDIFNSERVNYTKSR